MRIFDYVKIGERNDSHHAVFQIRYVQKEAQIIVIVGEVFDLGFAEKIIEALNKNEMEFEQKKQRYYAT